MELLRNHDYGELDSGNLSKFPEIPHQLSVSNLGNLTKSSPELGKLKSYIIDHPRDEGLQRREKLWNFQQKNRGAIVRIKTNLNVKGSNDKETSTSADLKSETEKDTTKQKQFSKLKSRQKFESRGSGASTGANECAPAVHSNSKESNLIYSSDLQIGNTLYNQIRGKDKENLESTSAGSDEARRSIVHSIDKLPNLSTSLTKLGYLKMTKNVVHYGGGFFGRHADKRYTDLRRTWTTIPSTDSIKKSHVHLVPMETSCNERQKVLYHPPEIGTSNNEKHKGQGQKGTVKQFEFWEPLSLNVRSVKHQSQSTSQENPPEQALVKDSSKQTRPEENSLKRLSQKSDDTKGIVQSNPVNLIEIHGIKRKDKLEGEDIHDKNFHNLKKYHRLLPPAPVITRQYLEDKQDKGLKRVGRAELSWNERANKVERRKRLQKQAKHKVTDWLQSEDDNNRPSSDISLDIPADKFGHTSQRKGEKAPPSYGIRPYRWNNKPNLSVDDKGWVEREIGKNTVIDNSTYDTFARTKPASLPSISKEQTSFLDGAKSFVNR